MVSVAWLEFISSISCSSWLNTLTYQLLLLECSLFHKIFPVFVAEQLSSHLTCESTMTWTTPMIFLICIISMHLHNFFKNCEFSAHFIVCFFVVQIILKRLKLLMDVFVSPPWISSIPGVLSQADDVFQGKPATNCIITLFSYMHKVLSSLFLGIFFQSKHPSCLCILFYSYIIPILGARNF